MKTILIIFLFCLLHFENAGGQQSLKISRPSWSNKSPREGINSGIVASKEAERKHKKGNSIRKSKEKGNKKGKGTKQRNYRRNLKKGRKINGSKKINKNVQTKNIKKVIKRGKEEAKKQNIQKRKQSVFRKRLKKRNKQKNYYKKNTKETKRAQKIKKRKKMKKVKKQARKRSKKQKKKQRQQKTGKNDKDNVRLLSVCASGLDLKKYIQDYTKSKTQINRANRIFNKPKKMKLYSETNFLSAFDALDTAIRSIPSGCSGSVLTNANYVVDELRECHSELPFECSLSTLEPEVNLEKGIQAEKCKPRLNSFTQGFQRSVNQGGTTPSGFVDTCSELDSQALPTSTFESPKKLKDTTHPDGPCLPANVFQSADAKIRTRFMICKGNPDVRRPISRNYCMTVLQAAFHYVQLCESPGSRLNNFAPFITEIYDQLLQLENRESSINALCIFNPTHPSCDPPENCIIAGTCTVRQKKALAINNFTNIVSALNTSTADGTICNGLNIPEDAKNLYNTLKNCSSSIPDICKPPQSRSSSETSDCSRMMKSVITEYEVIQNASNIGEDVSSTEKKQRNIQSAKNEANITNILMDLEKTTNITMLVDGTCYRDQKSPHRILKVKLANSNTNTPDECKERCFNGGHMYAGVEFKHECYCGNNTPLASEIRKNSKCNMACTGDANKFCGGSWHINIYKTDRYVKPELMKLLNMRDEIVASNCMDKENLNINAKLNETLSRCTDVNVPGSHANCMAAEKAAIPYIISCMPVSQAGSLTTASSRWRKLRFK